MAVDINKEEEALRSGIERSALALKSRLEPTLMKNDSLDSNGSGSPSGKNFLLLKRVKVLLFKLKKTIIIFLQ